MKLTADKVKRIAGHEQGQVFYWDDDLRDFGPRVGAQDHACIAQGRARGRTLRVTIGKHGVFTADGLRRNEAERLQWKNIDLKAGTLTVKDTKNHGDHTLPLSDFLLAMLKRRKENAGDSSYVFPGDGVTGHLIEIKRPIAAVVKASGAKVD